ncbi:hypothetical protein CRG98_024573 [Punica granatum]|uniref:Uncharacterized protein n=1 Tax=Punica granatum TaxID=22663 RepID=A0A2I0JFK1_PUNGR|nr:hypothetical protein CRG98_024573 [Punica granatum]
MTPVIKRLRALSRPVCSRACPARSTAPRAVTRVRLRPTPLPARLPTSPHTRAHLAACPTRVNVHALPPERPFEDSTESPHSQTLPRLFPCIPRLGRTFSS